VEVIAMQIVITAIERSKRRDAIVELDATDIEIGHVTVSAVCEALEVVCAGSAEIVPGLREFWGSDGGACWCVRVTR
jgi:hypothetical protein